MSSPGYDGIVLAGGRARRMGGVGKPALEVGGRALLDIALAALAGARVRVVVGAGLDVPGVLTTSEEPPGGGPVAALAAGLPHVTSDVVVVLAADLPFVDEGHVARLVHALGAAAAALAVDEEGNRQPLLGAYRRTALASALVGDQAGRSVRSLLAALEPGGVREVHLEGAPAPWYDCDTPEQLAAARAARPGRG